MSEQYGPNFAPGSFALQQSIRLVYKLRSLSRGRNRASRATRDNQMYTHTEGAHTRSATETQHNSQPETPKGSWPLLLPRRRHRRRRRCCCCCCCCCCAAAVLLLCCCFCCCCFSTRDASRSTTRLNRLFLVLCFMERTQERVTAQQQQQYSSNSNIKRNTHQQLELLS